MKKKLVPELRFPEFSGEWKDKNLGDVLIERNVKCKDGDYEVISSTTNGLYYQKDYFNRDIASDDKSGYKILEKEQIVFSPQNLWMGNINFNDSIDIGIVSPSYKIYDIKKNYYPYFIKHIIKTPYMMYQYLQSSEQGASVVRRNLNIELFYSCKVSIPSIEEQKKLASFFNLIDKKIEKQEEKIASMEEYKRGMMQKLFPKKGENVPEIRFKGFTDPWEQRKLGELGSVAMNKRIFKDQTSEVGDVPFYKIGTFGGEPDAYIPRELFEEYKAKYPYPEVGDILISASGSIGRTVEYTGEDEYFQDSNIVWLKHDGRLNNSFLKQFYMVVEWEGLEGSTIKRLYNKNILETQILLPSLAEQEKIGHFFNHLDNLITLHQRKLEELKELKKGFMQKMFI